MEFSNAYAISPIFASVTKTLFYNWATFTHEDGRTVEGAGSQRGRSVIARTLLTEPVFARLDKASDDQRLWMRAAQPNFFLPFDRAGIDPFTERFQVTLRLEGTVRGTGGVRVVDDACATSAAGLFAAGDAATRERICGAFTGGGSHNAAWAISSGRFAGRGAAEFASRFGRSRDRAAHGVGGRALRPGRPSHAIDTDAVVRGVQNEVMPYDKNLFRSDRRLKESSSVLDGLWQELDGHAPVGTQGLVRAREAAAMVATARWMYASARTRTETRGMHKHEDFASLDVAQQRCVLTGGLDTLWVRPDAG
jgi:succinate dehydrogenase/fumarate reductase flavoprotein subunit